MKPIESEFKKDGYQFRLIDRVGDFGLFRKTKGEAVESFEVVKIQKCKAHTWPDGRTTEARESMPCSEQWGTYGWTHNTIQAARQCLGVKSVLTATA